MGRGQGKAPVCLSEVEKKKNRIKRVVGKESGLPATTRLGGGGRRLTSTPCAPISPPREEPFSLWDRGKSLI